MRNRSDRETNEMTRRSALEALLVGLVAAGCGSVATEGTSASSSSASSSSGSSGSSSSSSGASASSASASSSGSGTCEPTPDETAGPYPDKTGMLQNQAFFRADVTEGKTGLPLAVTLVVERASASCAPIQNAVVEIWHCDKDGVYSEYGGQPGVADQTGTTFLRGLQTSDASGSVTFKTIYPGWYAGRATHIHVDVYLDGATQPTKTTQLAFPEDITSKVYATALYTKGQNPMTNAEDMVFGDGDTLELATLEGDTTNGYTATLHVIV